MTTHRESGCTAVGKGGGWDCSISRIGALGTLSRAAKRVRVTCTNRYTIGAAAKLLLRVELRSRDVLEPRSRDVFEPRTRRGFEPATTRLRTVAGRNKHTGGDAGGSDSIVRHGVPSSAGTGASRLWFDRGRRARTRRAWGVRRVRRAWLAIAGCGSTRRASAPLGDDRTG